MEPHDDKRTLQNRVELQMPRSASERPEHRQKLRLRVVFHERVSLLVDLGQAYGLLDIFERDRTTPRDPEKSGRKLNSFLLRRLRRCLFCTLPPASDNVTRRLPVDEILN
ncbi:hypothetical protein EVAR_89358_1 [Eumeta japonica]|uniref:Uncharacterized protein n=1 Tax=Eumeta variegata TaxID=151549 RepID=A0A4C1Y4E0_EUMVA|nr:hypothetical protein EVAR_89358_1 [Eumeta japonica]